MFIKKYLFCVLVMFAISAPAMAWKVDKIQGKDFAIELNGKKIESVEKLQLSVGMKLITKAQTKVLLKEGNSQYILAENTEVMISTNGPKITQMDLQLGKIRAQIDKPEAVKYEYKVPSAVIGVRGTEFFMSAASDKNIVCVLEGHVQTKETDKEAVMLEKNQGWFKESSKDAKIIETSEDQRKKWLEMTSL